MVQEINVYALLPLTAFYANLFLGCYIIYRNSKERINKIFCLFACALALWALGDFFTFLSTTPTEGLYWGKLGTVGSSLTPAFLLHFFLVFSKSKFLFKKTTWVILYLPALFFIIINLTTNMISELGKSVYWGHTNTSGILYFALAFYIIGYIIIGFFICYRFYIKEASKKEKIQLKLLIVAISIPLTGGIMTQVIPKVFEIEVLPLSTTLTTITAILIAYTITRHELMTYSALKKKLETTAIALNEREEKLRSILETAPAIIMTLDRDGKIQFINYALPGQIAEETIGTSIYNYLPSEYHDQMRKAIEHIFEIGENVDFETKVNLPDGRTSWYSTHLGPLTRDNKIVNITQISTDITQQKMAENKIKEKVDELEKSKAASLNIMEDLHETLEKLEKSQKIIEQKNIELEKLNDIKSAFLNVTSHELRTPMSAIKGYIQMMIREKLGDINKDQKNALAVVLRNTERLDHLIQDILDISRLESGTMKFSPDDTDVGMLVKETAETMLSVASLKNIKINTFIDKEIPDLFIDPERIKQVIVNLTGNAIKFSKDGSIINLRVKKENQNIIFEVQDFGRGIPKEHQQKIFETFYQVYSGTDSDSQKFGGAGLGLAISHGIVIAHGGQIFVDSKGIPGKGSTFKFLLPVDSIKDIEERFKGVDVFGLDKNHIDKKSEIRAAPL